MTGGRRGILVVIAFLLAACSGIEYDSVRECSEYTPDCWFGSLQKCSYTAKGCKQCECLSEKGEPIFYPRRPER